MRRYAIIMLVFMFCFAGCHCGNPDGDTKQKPKINDTNDAGYCKQFSGSCQSGSGHSPDCREPCLCDRVVNVPFQTMFECKHRNRQ
ncbi:hypothetical protein MRX96_027463 [Rhipicephalus microplus]